MDRNKLNRNNKKSKDEQQPEATYTRFGEKIRHVVPGPMQCSMACGGKNCKWENPDRWSDADQCIKGVFSSWVLDDVVAMSRPSTKVIRKYRIISQFKRNNICSIINLQRRGEHASCGPPLEKDSLFTYNPQEFMDNDIFFYNFGWKDYGVTSMSTILDMVKVMSFALTEGKVAVHCHAGLGRTGVLIACYLVYSRRMEAGAAIRCVREKRGNSIQTRGQIACIHQFWLFIRPLRIIFPQVVPNARRVTLEQFIFRQRQILHGYESRELRFVPKLIHIITSRLIELLQKDSQPEESKEPKFKIFPLKRHNTIAEIQRYHVNNGKEIEQESGDNQQTNNNNNNQQQQQQLSFTLSSRLSVSDGELSRCHDEMEATTSDQLQKSWSNITQDPTSMLDNHEDEDEEDVFDDEQLKKDVDEILEKNHPRNANNNNIASERNSTSIQKNSTTTLIHNEDDDDDEETGTSAPTSANSRRRLMQIGPSPAVLPTGSPIKAYQNPNAPNKSFRRTSSKTENLLPSSELSTLVASSGMSRESSNITNVEDDNSITSSSDESTPDEGEEEVVQETTEKTVECSVDVDRVKQSTQQQEDTAERGDSLSIVENNVVEIPVHEGKETNSNVVPAAAAGNLPPSKLEPIVDPDDENVELDEIIEIDNNVVTKSSQQQQEDLSKNQISTNDFTRPSTENKENLSLPSNPNNGGGRITPLMYRGERITKALENAESTAPDDRDHNSADDATIPSQVPPPPPIITSHRHDVTIESDRQPHRGDIEHKNQNSGEGSVEIPPTAKTLLMTPNTKTAIGSKSLVDLRSTYRSDGDDDVIDFPPSSVKTPATSGPVYVARALSYKLVDDEYLWEKVYTRQVAINKSNETWKEIARDDDAFALASLMWSWLEHLQEPVLSPKDFYRLHTNTSTFTCEIFEKSLKAVGKSVHGTVMCILNCILSFPPLPRTLVTSIINRTVIAITTVKTNNTTNPIEDEKKENNKQVEELTSIIDKFCDLKFEECGKSRYCEDDTEVTEAAKYIEPHTCQETRWKENGTTESCTSQTPPNMSTIIKPTIYVS